MHTATPHALGSRAEAALMRAEWQQTLFGAENRAELASCVPAWPLEAIRIRVHRNHAFEPVASATRAYAAWNGLDFVFTMSGYDDSLSFDCNEADVDVVWFDSRRITTQPVEGRTAWLAGRLATLRAATTNPILVMAWPLVESELDEIREQRLPGTHVIDLDPLAAALGERWLDPRAASLSGTEFSNRACLRIAKHFACRWLPAVALPPRKAIAVDLDGTLYSGVLAEDGCKGVELSEAHRVLHQKLVALREQGILLALVSRNIARDVEELFRERPDFPLRLSDFATLALSWDDKTTAVARVADDLGVGVDSMIFVDDNPGELSRVAASLPVFTVHATVDATGTLAALDGVAGLFRFAITPEDRLRADDLRASSIRIAAARSAVSTDDYLRSLHVRLDFLVDPRQHVARLAQLSAKTNQFNLALARMTEAQIERKLVDPCSAVVAVCLRDRLSDSGVVALLVAERRDNDLHLVELCVSCRALGRGLEDALVTEALMLMTQPRIPQRIAFAIRRGPRNAPARQWLAAYVGQPVADDASAIEIAFEGLRGKRVPPQIDIRVVR